MLSVTRRSQIKEMVLENKSVTVSALATQFNVTEETIRRDLKSLEQEGVLYRTYGGAYILEGVQNEVNVNLRENAFIKNKKIIAKKAKTLINNGDSIFLDNSTTAAFLAEELKDMRLTVITNSLMIINALCNNANIRLLSTGGSYFAQHKAFLGHLCARTVSFYNLDSAFISCRTLSMQKGITDSSEELSQLRQSIVSSATKSYIIADYTKFNKSSFITTCSFDAITGIITDTPLSDEWHEFLRKKNIEYLD